MPTIELTFKLEISEESLTTMRDLQNYGEFTVNEALSLLRDAMPLAELVRVEDDNV